MNKRNPLLIVLVVVAFLSGFLVLSLNYSRSNERKRRIQKETELAGKTTELAAVQGLLSKLKASKEEMERELNDRIASLEAELLSQQDSQKSIAVRLESLLVEKEELENQLAEKDKRIDEITGKLNQVEADKADLLNSLQNLKKEPSQNESAPFSESRSETLEAEAPMVKLGQIVIQKSTGSAAKVLQVDRGFGFVVISAGAKDGLRPGWAIHIIRNNKLVGKAVLQKIRESVSAATLLPEYSTADIQAGDLISLA